MITIHCHRPSDGARLLVDRLNAMGHPARRVVGGTPPQNALLWGRGGGNKFRELATLHAAGVRVPAHQTYPPAGKLGINGNGWLARTAQHMGARDLVANLKVGDFYVKYVPTVREHRIHIFKGESIRVQTKVPRIANPNPTFRAHATGWKFVSGPEYTAQVPPGARDLAKRAVRALGYVFGAVDIGVMENGEPIVWEVNTQPGIEGSTVDVYAQAVARHFA